jgi:hypothetical protein
MVLGIVPYSKLWFKSMRPTWARLPKVLGRVPSSPSGAGLWCKFKVVMCPPEHATPPAAFRSESNLQLHGSFLKEEQNNHPDPLVASYKSCQALHSAAASEADEPVQGVGAGGAVQSESVMAAGGYFVHVFVRPGGHGQLNLLVAPPEVSSSHVVICPQGSSGNVPPENKLPSR